MNGPHSAFRRLALKSSVHPFLFAVYPIIFLYAQNVHEFPPSVLILPVLVSLLLTLILRLLLGMLVPRPAVSSWILSLFLFFFFSYGHLYHLLEQSRILRHGILGDVKSVLSIYGIVFLTIAIVSVRRIRNWEVATRIATVFGLFLLSVSLLQLSIYLFTSKAGVQKRAEEKVGPAAGKGALPDIYYVILDGYPRADVLLEEHNYDNAEFLDFLLQRGFFVASQSHSNYSGTSLSLGSSLNLDYLDKLLQNIKPEQTNRWPLTDLIQRNRVLSIVKQQGYETMAIASGYFPTEIRSADRFLSSGWISNEFHDAVIDTTPAWVLIKNVGRYALQRKRILSIFDQIPQRSGSDRPLFVFAHVMALHPPFVFGADGEEIRPADSPLKFWKDFAGTSKNQERRQYIAQLTFVNKKIQQMVDQILSSSKRPAIIILQGDHGSAFRQQGTVPDAAFYKERFSILNAMRMPPGVPVPLYPSMSPVNTFRSLFASLFDMDFPPLPDHSYFSRREKPYRFLNVTELLKSE